jgi:tetratricopeptide (TPR) repeat protein
MKSQIFLQVVVLFSALILSAQDKIQWSTVREQNSNKRPIAYAQVIFSDAATASSDQNGKLRLAFRDKKPGTYVFLTEVQKEGYELVNNKELEQVKISEGEQFGVDIILAKAGLVEASKKQYYGISDQALKVGFEREKAKIRTDLQAARLTAEQFEKEKAQLEKDYERQQKELEVLAEKFARVNFDDVSQVYEEALEAFKAGKIDEAIAKLESVNPVKRTAAILKEEKNIAAGRTELDKRTEAFEKEKRQQIANLRLLADMYSIKLDFNKTEAQYDDLLQLDSTNLEVLRDAAFFALSNHHYNKSLKIYKSIILNPASNAWEVANSNFHMGELYMSMGDLPAALEAYTKHFDLCNDLLQKHPKFIFYKQSLLFSLERLGVLHEKMGSFEKAQASFEKYNFLAKELHDSYPDNVDIKDALAISYSDLGNIYIQLGNLNEALSFFEAATKIFEELSKLHPQNLYFKSGLAISMSRLGDAHSKLENLEKALAYCDEAMKIFKNLCESYPQNVDFKDDLGIAYQNLGEVYIKLGDLEKALTFFELYNTSRKELNTFYPQNVGFKNGLAISYERLGFTYSILGDLEKALAVFDQYNTLKKDLYIAHPHNMDFKNGLAISYQRLGSTYRELGNLERALISFEQFNLLAKELFDEFPQNLDFKKSLVISYYQLGELYRDKFKSKKKALIYLKQAEKLRSESIKK